MQYIVNSNSVLAHIEDIERSLYFEAIKKHRKDELMRIKEKFGDYEGLRSKVIDEIIKKATD